MTSAPVLAAIAAVFLVAYVRSTRAEPRRWRNGVLLLVVAWAALAAALRLLDLVLDRVSWDDDVVMLALPWVLAMAVGVVLVVNGLQMVSREGRTLGNLLSFLLGIAMTGATVIGAGLLVAGTELHPQSGSEATVLRVLGLVVLLLPGYPALALLSYLLYCLAYLRHQARLAPTAVVVLGSGLVDGEIPRLLANRLDAALAVRRAEEARGNRPLLVPSGGQGDDEPIPEGEAMTRYLVDHGVDHAAILTEHRATTTEENLLLSRRLLDERGVEGALRVVTSNYHVGRAALLTRRLGLEADVTGAPTAWYFLPSAFVREFAAVVLLHPWVNLAGLLLWSALTTWVVTTSIT